LSVQKKIAKCCVKGDTSLKNANPVIIFSPSIIANQYEFLSSAEHKGRYFEERLEQLFGTIDFHSRKKYYGSQRCQTTVWIQSFFKYLPLCSAEEKKSYWFAIIEGEKMMTGFAFLGGVSL